MLLHGQHHLYLHHLGDASKGKTGLLNADGVAIDAATATFATANESQILQMFNKLIGGTATGTAYRFAFACIA